MKTFTVDNKDYMLEVNQVNKFIKRSNKLILILVRSLASSKAGQIITQAISGVATI